MLRKEEEESMDMKDEEKGMAMDDENMDDEKMMDEKAWVNTWMMKPKPTFLLLMEQVSKLANLLIESLLTTESQEHLICQQLRHFYNDELETFDLSVGNIEKAYEAFRQEQT